MKKLDNLEIRRIYSGGIPSQCTKNIIVSGGWSYGNIGDEVIALCTIHLISKSFKNCDIIYTSYNKDDFSRKYNVNTECSVHNIVDKLSVKKLNIEYIIKHLGECGLKSYSDMFSSSSIFIMSGGGYFVGDWKTSFISRILEIEIAKRAGAKIAVIGQSIGPVFSEKDKRYLVNALSACNFISVRDQSTRNYLKSIGIKTDVYYYPDIAVICSDIIKSAVKRDVICISPAGYVRYQSISKSRMRYAFDCFINKYHILRAIRWRIDFFRRRYFREFKELVSCLSLRHHLLFVMSTEWKGNADFTEYLCSDMDDSSYEIAYCESAEELCQRISEAKIIVSAKMHPLIIANSYGIPTIGISYNFKLDNFMEMIGRGDKCVIINKINHKAIIRLIEDELKQTQGSYTGETELKDKVYKMMMRMTDVLNE